MTNNAKRNRAVVYLLLMLLAVLLPMTGWFARSVTATPNREYPRSLRPYVSCAKPGDSFECAEFRKTVYVTRTANVRH